ncbi:MAG: ABC transporter permease [Pseudolabrys sp.]|nr:ABC transporter permease [Pseudolabrys sp.]
MTAARSPWAFARTVYLAAFFSFFYVPILTLFVLSFNDSPVMGFPFKTATTQWYGEAVSDGVLLRALINSVQLGLVSAAIGTALALSAAIGLRYRLPFKKGVIPLMVLPIILPGIVTGVVMLVFFGLSGVSTGLWPTTLIVHVSWVLPFAFLTLYPRIHGFDQTIEEAAMDLGARPTTVFLRIVFPLIRPAVLATFLFAFTLSFDEFVRTFFVIGSQRTVPVHLWILVTEQVAPFLPAVGIIIMLATLSVAAVGFFTMTRASAGRAPRAAQQ